MDLVKSKRVFLTLILSLLVGFLSGCDIELPIFLTKPDVYEVYTLLDKYYYKDLDFKMNEVNSVEEILERLNDPYTYLYVPNTRTIELDESYYGIGISIIDQPEGLLISDTNPLAGLEKSIYIGDIITEINGVALAELVYNDRIILLQGDLGDTFNLKVKRGDQEVETAVSIKEIPLNSVTSMLFENKIAYIDINRFAGKTGMAFRTELAKLEAENPTGLIIDVRNNGGGYLTAVVDIISNFATGTDPVVTMHRIYDDLKTPYYANPSTVRKTYPIVVLMNENSASASEVLAMAMRENGNYPLLGQKSFGKFVYQTTLVLQRQSREVYLNMTEGYWYSPLNNTVEGGILPDVEINQTGVLGLSYPIYKTEITLDQSLETEATLVELVNLLEDTLPDRSDLELFDNDFETKVRAFQTAQALSVTGTLNYETIMFLIDYYRLAIELPSNDLQLQQTISYLVNYESQ